MLTLNQVKNKSIARLENLIPVVATATERLIEHCYARGVLIVITQGYRSAAEQDKLYAQGRTAAGSIVTNARGGYSYHNFGVAIDFALLSPDGKQVFWDTKRDGNVNQIADWAEVVDEAKRLGFAWGGDWTSFKDYPHFEMTFGLSTAQLRAGIRPTAAQITAAMAIITKEESYMMKAEDANALIKRYLQPAWAACKQKGDTAGMQEAHRLANELRKASGQKEQ
ncbi:M15 family metallopeptidase [Paenibacillus sp. KS-LC4]|uniref:M15 family metallopeptidase n=1 Tax=Paenibacillus sp. KS-LC4 TaxID=2979727 RepID=UPI0030D3A1D1